MKINKYILIIFLIIFTFISIGNFSPPTSTAMTKTQWDFAQNILRFAYKAKKVTGLPASITTAIIILETGWGKYIPTDMYTGKFSYNLFGIKGIGNNGFVEIYTHEYVNGERIRIKAKFRAYNSYAESFIDYSNLILGAKRYREAVLNKDDPVKYIECIWKAGYATDINYASRVLEIARQCKFIK